jgi:hypothetical protein
LKKNIRILLTRPCRIAEEGKFQKAKLIFLSCPLFLEETSLILLLDEQMKNAPFDVSADFVAINFLPPKTLDPLN